jgi:signal transduction histidine kinase
MKYLILSIDEKWRIKKNPIDFIPLLHILDEGVRNQYSIIDDLLSKFDQGESLELAIKRKIEAIFSKSEVKFEVLFLLKEATLTNHQKTQLYRILTELITNTIKHARGTSCVSIQIKDTNPIEITYSDDGKGTNAVINTNGKGLENIKFRIDQLQGTIRNLDMIDGFTLEFYIPRMYEENINLPDR